MRSGSLRSKENTPVRWKFMDNDRKKKRKKPPIRLFTSARKDVNRNTVPSPYPYPPFPQEYDWPSPEPVE